MKRIVPLCLTIIFAGMVIYTAQILSLITHKTTINIHAVNAEVIGTLSVDFSKQISTGSPLIFGGVHAPDDNQQDAWNLLKSVGVTSIRKDFFLEYELPDNITIKDYINNTNDVQNTDNWNKENIDKVNNTFKNAKSRGMTVIGILSYIPNWLGYIDNHSVPRNWEVYKDIVKKAYKLHRPYIDYIEIWNEPDNSIFLNTSKSGLNNTDAYLKIYNTAVSAIREVDKEIEDGKETPILAPAIADSKNVHILDSILENADIGNLKGVTVHSYSTLNSSWTKVQESLSKHNYNLPIFIDEWNYSPSYRDNSYNYTNAAITYTGTRLIEFLEKGIGGANYFSTTRFNNSSDSIYEKFGFYEIKDSKTTLLPQGKTWNLLSNTLGLGKGESKIFFSNSTLTASIGFINSDRLYGSAVVNNDIYSRYTKVYLNNLPMVGKATVRIFHASINDDGSQQECSEIFNVIDNNINFGTILPERSITGISVEPLRISAESILNVLGIRTSADCIIK